MMQECKKYETLVILLKRKIKMVKWQKVNFNTGDKVGFKNQMHFKIVDAL